MGLYLSLGLSDVSSWLYITAELMLCFLSLTQKAHDVDLSLVKNKYSRPSFKTVKKDFIQEGVAAMGLKC